MFRRVITIKSEMLISIQRAQLYRSIVNVWLTKEVADLQGLLLTMGRFQI